MEWKLPHGAVELPAFFPDGTYGVVRSLDATDLAACGVPGLVMNGFHLLSHPGLGVIRAAGGLNALTGWERPILTDSGGFQVFSMIRENPKYGSIDRSRIVFRPDGGERVVLTPEKSVQSQFAYGSDVIMCLDYCTHMDEPPEVFERSVEITVAWAGRCRQEYDRQVAARGLGEEERPRLFAIIQGGGDKALRTQCADALKAIGFDGYGFGGWPLDGEGNLAVDILRHTAAQMPDHLPKYAMGLGRPEGVAACRAMGYNLFDCVIPTREARHNRLYVWDGEPGGDDSFYHFHYVLDDVYAKDMRPVCDDCDCLACRRYSRAYLRHLYKVGDSLAYRLGTMHNLRFYTRLMEALRGR